MMKTVLLNATVLVKIHRFLIPTRPSLNSACSKTMSLFPEYFHEYLTDSISGFPDTNPEHLNFYLLDIVPTRCQNH